MWPPRSRAPPAGVIAGIDRVTNNHSGPSVANLSLHGGASSTLDTAVRNFHRERRHLRRRGRQQQRQRLLVLPGPRHRGDHGRRHHQHRRPGRLLPLRLGPGRLRPRLLHARRGRGRGLLRRSHLGHPGPGRHGPGQRCHVQRGHQPRHRLARQVPEDRAVRSRTGGPRRCLTPPGAHPCPSPYQSALTAPTALRDIEARHPALSGGKRRPCTRHVSEHPRRRRAET